jgi:hypothetical protein
MRILSKAIRVLGAVVALLVLAVVCIILVVDPLPLRFSDGDNFVLSVKAPRQIDRKLAGSIERGLSCKVRLESYASGNFGRPVITIFDWLKQQTGALREPDYHIYGTKPNSAWAITNKSLF